MTRLRPAAAVLLVLLAGWLLAGVGTAAPASAHAELLSSTPASGEHVGQVPGAVKLRFSEHVSIGPGYARVLGPGGSGVDTGTPRVDGDTVTIPLRSGLPQGGYVVSWRVISADSHPVSGAYSFVVGAGALVPTGGALAARPTDPVIAAALPVARWLGYAGLALSIGLPVFAAVCWAQGWASRRLTRLAVWGAVAVAVSGLASFLLQGPYTAGSGAGSILDPALLSATASSGPGMLLLVRTGLAAVGAAALALAWRGSAPGRAAGGALAALGIGTVATTAAVGHAAAGAWTGLALASTAVHVAAMAVWIGGLTGLLVGVLRSGVPVEQMARALPRFSRVAFGAVTALVLSGVIQAVREVSTPGALFTTTYGWILVSKLLVLAVVLAAAGVSRVWVQQHYRLPGRRPDGRRRVTAQAFSATATSGATAASADAAATLPAFRRSVVVELALTVAILALSAVLVGTAPAAAAAPQPLEATLQLHSTTGVVGSVQVSLVPARPGPNSLHLYVYDRSGQLASPAGIQVTVTDPGDRIGDLVVPLVPAGPGHYLADSVSLPTAGTWTLTVTERVDTFTAATASTRFPVR